MKVSELDNDEVAMLSQYIQNQQQIINELTEKNMQLTTEIQIQRMTIKQLESINNTKIKSKKRISAFKQERMGILRDAINQKV